MSLSAPEAPLSPLAANISLNEVDWLLDAVHRKTAEGDYAAVNYHHFANDIGVPNPKAQWKLSGF